MRILLLDHPQFTHGTFFLWHGLKEIERDSGGQIEVSVYPDIPTHYDQDSFNLLDMVWYHRLAKAVEEKRLPWGIPPFGPDETLTYHGQEQINRYVLAQKFPRTGPALDEMDVVSLINQGHFDFIILGNSHRVPTILLGRLYQRVLKGSMPPVVYYDAGERDELNEHWLHAFRPALTFKQILTPAVRELGMTSPIDGYKLKMLPLPLSSIMVDYPDTKLSVNTVGGIRRVGEGKKSIDVFYPMGNTFEGRQEILDSLDALAARHPESCCIGKTQTYETFHLCICQARMAVTMRGSGRDTLRYWEIPLYRTPMVSDGTMGCIHPYPFRDELTAIFWKDAADLVRKVQAGLERTGIRAGELDRIAVAGQAHLKKYHSTMMRAVFFLDQVRIELGLGKAERSSLDAIKQSRGWTDAGMNWEGPVA